MKKTGLLILVLLLFGWCSIPAYAQNEQDVSQQEDYQQIADDIAQGIESATDDDVNRILQEQEISLEKPESISKISVGSVIESIVSSFTDVLKKPMVMLGKIIVITILCVVAKSLAPEASSVTRTFNIIGVLSIITVMFDTIYSSVEVIRSSLERLSEFMMAYIPVFSSIVAVGGSVTASGSYYATTLFICEMIGYISNHVIMPFLSIVLATSLVSAINPNLQFSGTSESIKKACQWIMGGMMTIFVGLLTIQGFSGTATDSLATRAVKFAASSFIPVIGGAVSEAYSTIHSSVGVIRTGVGTIGIIIICIMVLKPILSIIAIKFIISLSQMISDLFGQKECSEFLKSTNAVMSIGLSVVICFSLVFVIATAVLMLTAMNIGV